MFANNNYYTRKSSVSPLSVLCWAAFSVSLCSLSAATVKVTSAAGQKAAPATNAALVAALAAAEAAAAQQLALANDAGVGENPANRPLVSLKTVSVPTPPDLANYIADRQAAIALGKALFWDAQVGSDGVTACASCHFHAGADNREINTLAPALLRVTSDHKASPDTTIDKGANAVLSQGDFPFHKLSNINDRQSAVLSDTTDIVGGQGVYNESFKSLQPSKAEENRQVLPDGTFSVGGANTRRVTPRNVPTVINAVFNLRNFWDGRAQDTFNGVNPFGARDKNATVLRAASPNAMTEVSLRIQYASLASQAVGPPLSDIEMSASGRTFADIGKKMLSLRPLATQAVHPSDSVFSTMVHKSGKGLSTANYLEMVKKAFRPEWWQGASYVETVAGGGTRLIPTPTAPAANQYSHAAWNFSLFFGLAIQMYESTLVSDQSPFDKYSEGLQSALTDQQRKGLDLFSGKAKCASCHNGGEFTSAAVGRAASERIERMQFATAKGSTSSNRVVYDNGFYNIGVRPTTNDLGLGVNDPFGFPLSETRLFFQGLLSQFGLPSPSFKLDTSRHPSADGSFKVPTLRNVELTAPYFHNGGQGTLRQVVDFYNRGGDFKDVNLPDVPKDIEELGLSSADKDAIVAFLRSLTDPRVQKESAPFDHPQLMIPNGHSSAKDAAGRLVTVFKEIPAVGKAGGVGQPNFLPGL